MISMDHTSPIRPASTLRLERRSTGRVVIFGFTLDALNDCLRGGFGARTPFTLIWRDFEIARESLATPIEGADGPSSYYDAILTILQDHDVAVVLR